MNRLRVLKVEVKIWERKKKEEQRRELSAIEEELKSFHKQMTTHSLPNKVRERICALELEKKNILQVKEMTWRLKSIALWIKEGYKNTNLFHHFSNYRSKQNTIWKMNDGEGNNYNKQSEITFLAVTYFKKAYSRVKVVDVESQICPTDEYPQIFNEEDNMELFKEVEEDELNQAIKSMKGDKNLGPDGWIVEFFSHFIDIFQENLL